MGFDYLMLKHGFDVFLMHVYMLFDVFMSLDMLEISFQLEKYVGLILVRAGR